MEYFPGWWAVKLRYISRLPIIWHVRRRWSGEIVDYWDRCKFIKAALRKDMHA